ncbi:MAG: cobyrinate a,c-diamide synthase [Deltaproteobacteria bacterium]|nr:cobyrinate a,c-diamide synthase [Deltaproteobacteria bacterium]
MRHTPLTPAPRLTISGLRGGAGKTLLSLGLARALAQDGLRLKPFKKGPDYIDAAWLGLAAGHPATNLDLFFLPPQELRALFLYAFALPDSGGKPADFALIEGNRGLFDGRDLEGTCSTAALARTLQCPILLSLDCTKMTRTAAALVQGILGFEPDLPIAGVVLNQVGSERHSALIRRAIEHYCPVPVLGALPRLVDDPLPERHMGLVLRQTTEAQRADAETRLDALAAAVRDHLDLNRIRRLAQAAPPLPGEKMRWKESFQTPAGVRPRIGYVRDAALWFYYEENLEALRRAGAEVIRLSLFDGEAWPRLDGLYLGGGFPEEFCAELAASPKLALLKEYAEQGMPIYAECGGFLLLADSLERQGSSYPMAGVFPVRACFHERPQGLGYVEASVILPNPFHPRHAALKGHEFHYTRCEFLPGAQAEYALQLSSGTGMGHGDDGLIYNSTFASYMHIFAPAVPHWAERFAAAAAGFAARDRGAK